MEVVFLYQYFGIDIEKHKIMRLIETYPINNLTKYYIFLNKYMIFFHFVNINKLHGLPKIAFIFY